MNNQVKPKHNFKFGDIIENHYASENNPIRIGIFVRKNSKGHVEMTNGKGKFWLGARDNDRLVKIGSVISDTPPVPTIKPGELVSIKSKPEYGTFGVESLRARIVPTANNSPINKAMIWELDDLEVVE